MQFELEDLEYQRRAIATVVGVLEGQIRNTFDNSNLFGIQANITDLTPAQIEENKKRIIAENGVSEAEAKLSPETDVCIEMETGTGKTLVYFRTIYELYSDAYLAFLRTIVFLRTLNASEDRLLDLWHLEKKLLQLLHVDSTGSPTWFLDACGQTGHPRRRLLLSHYDLGVEVPSRVLQLGLNFAEGLPELFAGREMGEDALRVLGDYLKFYHAIRCDVAAERPLAMAANRWAQRFK